MKEEDIILFPVKLKGTMKTWSTLPQTWNLIPYCKLGCFYFVLGSDSCD
jgi:hypothetical protein